MTMEIEQVDVVVVGTGYILGWNGLICAKTYLDLSPKANLILIDQGASIGGVWSTEKIYPSLYAQIKYGQFEYSCYPMRREGITEDGYVSGETIHDYLNDFAQYYHLARRTRLRTVVHKVARILGRDWRLDLESEIEGKRVVECAKLIYASGATSHAVCPSWPKSSTFDVPVIHSQDTGTHLDALANIERAIVVGAAKSAFDAVFLLLDAGKKVDWIIREDGSGPLALMPPTIGGVINTMEVVATRIMGILGASIMNTKGTSYTLVHKTRLGRLFTRQFWKVINTMAAAHAGYSKSPNAQKLVPLPHGQGVFWASAGLGVASVPNFWKTFHAGDCTVHRSEIESLTGNNTVNLTNSTQLQTDYVILCTGFDKSYQPFNTDLQQECGLMTDPDPVDQEKWAKLAAHAEETVNELLPVLRHSPVAVRDFKTINSESIISNGSEPTGKQQQHLSHGPSRHYRRLIVPALAARGDRSIIFPGFIHSIYTPLVSEIQALWGCAFLLGLHDPPSQAEMEKEVAEWNVWSRKRYPTQGRKHAYAIYDFLSYIDTLLHDLGIKTRRQSNLFTHLFLPVHPKEYRSLIGEFWSAYARKQVGRASDRVAFEGRDKKPPALVMIPVLLIGVALIAALFTKAN
ncbi:MAG: hypothetical protein M1818_008074 [Claussenomyces sp. TS43310]|nr:MAG: hypothetical protein M1818_008074 [Claussenomyces sp. TS43310]